MKVLRDPGLIDFTLDTSTNEVWVTGLKLQAQDEDAARTVFETLNQLKATAMSAVSRIQYAQKHLEDSVSLLRWP